MVSLGLAKDRLSIGNARHDGIHLDAELLLQLIKNNRQVQFALPLNDDLPEFGIVARKETGILFVDLMETRSDFVFVPSSFGLNGDPNKRNRKLNWRYPNATRLRGQRVARMGVL